MLLPLALTLLQSTDTPAPLAAHDPATRDAVHGEAPVLPAEHPDDGVPLPNPPQWKAGERGDELVAPASGDPFFLGFANGRHYPPALERIDPLLAQAAVSLPSDGRPTRETYAFVMFSKRMTSERVDALRSLGVRVLDFHPHYTLKVALAPELVERVGGLDFVRWLGVAQPAQRVQPQLLQELARLAPGERVPIHVNLFESDLCDATTSSPFGSVEHSVGPDDSVKGNEDSLPRTWMSNGWQQKRLEALGLEIRSYNPRLNSFRAWLAPEQLEALLALDFVQWAEFEPETRTLAHENSMPLIHADRTRGAYSGGTNSAAIVGVIDTGYDTGHTALDGYVVGWDFTPENAGAFTDLDGHGSHVAGTMLGNGDVSASYKGVAPGSGWAPNGRIFSAKIFNSNGSSGGVDYAAVLAAMHSSYNDGTAVTPRPMVINNSYGSSASGAVGTESAARTIDAEVWDHDQMLVFAAGNDGPSTGTCSLESSAKNAFTVGSVKDFNSTASDPGGISGFSSRGPCGDGRWKPNVVAPGDDIYSIAAETLSSYTSKSGTSMAAPHVTGLAAQLCDHYSFLRYNPEALAALLMATALTKNNETITGPTTNATHLSTYGAGRVDAYKAHYSTSQQSLYFWSTTLSINSTYVEFPVNAGATRLAVVVHYIEPEASSGASAALRNDFNSILDVEPFTAGNTTGDYSAQQSAVNNTELRILTNPTTGNWRIKVFPESVVLTDSVRVGISAVVTYGDTSPTPTLSVTSSDSFLQRTEQATITATYTNPSYIADAVALDITTSMGMLGMAVTHADGAVTLNSGNDPVLGNIAHGSSRTASWRVYDTVDRVANVHVQAISDTAALVSDSVVITIDSTDPGLATNLSSSSHVAGTWSRNGQFQCSWTAATDNLAGIDGYGTLVTANFAGLPGTTKDIEQVTSYSQAMNDGAWWFSLRAVDNCGNWAPTAASFGPIRIDRVVPGAVTGLGSSTHTVGVQSCNTSVTVSWNAASDDRSGVQGYATLWNLSPSTLLTNTPISTSGLSSTSDIGSTLLPRWFHIAAVDAAGNYGPTTHLGPIYASSASVATYCVGKANSLGCTPAITHNNVQPSRSAGNFTVGCTNALNNKSGLLFWAFQSASVPFQGGTKCVGSPTLRTVATMSGGNASGNSCTGTYSFPFTTSYMTQEGIDPGETVYAQWWMRDPASPSTTGLSNALRFTVCQ